MYQEKVRTVFLYDKRAYPPEQWTTKGSKVKYRQMKRRMHQHIVIHTVEYCSCQRKKSLYNTVNCITIICICEHYF